MSDDTAAGDAWAMGHVNAWLAKQNTWPTNLEEYTLMHFICLAVFVALTSMVDYWVNRVQNLLAPRESGQRFAGRRVDLRRELNLIVWTRLQGELMVVGSLVVWIWLAHETGLLDAVAWRSVAYQVGAVPFPYLHI